MDPTLEERAAVLLRSWIADRGTTPARVAAELGLEPAAVERMVSGREPVELARLERVLGVLGVGPGEFFGRLYGPGGGEGATPAPAAAAPPAASTAPATAGDTPGDRPEQPISRREVEEVVASLRSMIDGMARMLDAERAAGRENDR
jgi:transcriptional regulator with XRE-family HTH domain